MKYALFVPATVTTAVALALAAPLAASAHIGLEDDTAEAGSFALLTFTVPNESANAATDKIVIDLPDGFSSVSYVPVEGWTATVTPDAVTWTAEEDASIRDGQVRMFALNVGPVPDVDSLAFPVEQSYDDDTVVAWDGSADHPVPTLYVDPAGDSADSAHAHAPAADGAGADGAGADGAGAEAADAADADAAGADAADVADRSPDVLARVLAIGGLVLGVVALVIALASRRTAR